MRRNDTAWVLRNKSGLYISSEESDGEGDMLTPYLSSAVFFRSREHAKKVLVWPDAGIEFRPVRVVLAERKVKRAK